MGAPVRSPTPRAVVVVLVAGALLAAPACYDLGKVNAPARWIDDFSGPTPTWNLFLPWRCGTFVVEPPETGDGGAGDGGGAPPSADAHPGSDAGSGADAGPAALALCPFGPGDDFNYPNQNETTLSGLSTTFELPGATSTIGAAAETNASMGPVDFTGFKQLVFSARLESTAPAGNPLPATTELIAQLGCSRNGKDNTASQTIDTLKVDAAAWKVFRPDLALFTITGTSLSQSCLSEVDSIRFLVVPGNNEAPSISGTLSLDNVQLQN